MNGSDGGGGRSFLAQSMRKLTAALGVVFKYQKIHNMGNGRICLNSEDKFRTAEFHSVRFYTVGISDCELIRFILK